MNISGHFTPDPRLQLHLVQAAGGPGPAPCRDIFRVLTPAVFGPIQPVERASSAGGSFPVRGQAPCANGETPHPPSTPRSLVSSAAPVSAAHGGPMIRLIFGLFALVPLACIRAPEIVMVDRSTALEQQAAGSFDNLEHRLTSAGVAPRPVPLTPEQLEALGIHSKVIVDHTEATDADRIDDLLHRHCVGEGRDGLLVDTHRDCRGVSDRAATVVLIERVNRARVQMWRWMHEERRDSSADALQRIWRENHVRGVVCGGWVQHDDGTWGEKKC